MAYFIFAKCWYVHFLRERGSEKVYVLYTHLIVDNYGRSLKGNWRHCSHIRFGILYIIFSQTILHIIYLFVVPDPTLDKEETLSSSHDWTCTFEVDTKEKTMCGIEQDSWNDEFDWTLHKGRTPSEPTGPRTAHTGDYYIYIEATARQTHDKAV